MNSQDLLGSASSAAIRQYLRAAQDYDIEPIQALDAVGMPHGIMDNSISRTHGRAFQSLIRWLIEQTRDPLFGLKSSRYVQPGSYSLVGYMAMNCRTAREALHITPEYEAIVGDMGVTKIEKYGPHLAMRWVCQYDDPVVRPHMIDNVLGSWLVFARWLADMQDGKPDRVLFERSKPAPALLAVYEDIFQAPLEFGCDRSALIFPEPILDTPLRQPDPTLLATLEQQAASVMAELQEKHPIVMQTRSLLRSLMEEDLPRRDKVAAELGMTERTLQRRLQEAGTGYQQLLDDLRREVATNWLRTTNIPVNDIAARLGFSEARSFHRRFKAWTGMTPGEYRGK
ncbi:AraC family transcriptional regulator [Thalassolituus hydrocarboniclasticus]|uniref:AraC family transcriptional regulator n=1 Tax=Thalassolituus hydrocarboniclasticus TaxID=2742796 RepID=A0ABY6A9J0_9GAMM|nr:AraC family transcriptional regulator [Thalassolituus hydrocarboniclasticus]UXD87342.1 AraC family transcriptional regulator [Thalassolituus hydrocarboniclasticus]